MTTQPRIGYLIASVLLFMGWTRPAAADLILSFDQSNYTINGVGNTTAVQVFVSQTAGGPQVGPGNELLSAAIELTFPTTGAATVLSTADVTGGPAWDSSNVQTSTSGANTLFDLGLLSLLGISDMSHPLLLGTFDFTGQSPGRTSISVATLGPGPSFITVQGDVLDPTNTPNAEIIVQGQTAVPEPSSLMLMCLGGVTLGGRWLSYRLKRARASS
jgi:hypothetical protein